MARQIRIEYVGAIYHLVARGNQGQPIFADDRDRQLFEQTLGEACAKTGWRRPAWVLMPYHYHLLAETPEQIWSRGCNGCKALIPSAIA